MDLWIRLQGNGRYVMVNDVNLHNTKRMAESPNRHLAMTDKPIEIDSSKAEERQTRGLPSVACWSLAHSVESEEIRASRRF
jgi:hypothetical protein